MTGFLLDTNALLYILASKKQQKLDKNCHILDLTRYEYGNAIANMLTKRSHELPKEKAAVLIEAFEKTAELVTIDELDGSMMQATLELARKENLTFYDASYLYSCSVSGYNLVTEDHRLAKAAQNNSIKAIDSEKWARHSQ